MVNAFAGVKADKAKAKLAIENAFKIDTLLKKNIITII